MEDLEQGVEKIVEEVPSAAAILLVALVVGVIVFGITEVVKIPYHRYCKRNNKEHATWWKVFIRSFPIFLGALMGYFFLVFPWGPAVGGGAGVLSAVLYKRAKKLIKGVDTEDLIKP